MAITFRCQQCGKKIEAAKSAAGKWGKCPSCKHKIYVPDLESDDGQELKLAPVDEAEKQRQKQLMEETFKLEQDILKEREVPGEISVSVQISEKGLTNNIILYLRYCADGNLSQAQNLVPSIATAGLRAVEIIDRIAVSEMPEPELADMPPQVLAGFIRQLRAKIKTGL